MGPQSRIIPIYTSKGEAGAFLCYPYLYNLLGEWIGWVTSEKEVFSILGVYVGYLGSGPRILRKRASDYLNRSKTVPPIPHRMIPPATIPLAPLMSELTYDTLDVLLEEPEMLHTVDIGELRPDMD